MADTSDILKDATMHPHGEHCPSCVLGDPTGHLREALNPNLPASVARDFFRDIHRHLLAGGALPTQWRGEGTAVGALLGEVADLRKAAADWSLDLQQQAVAQLERADDLRRGSSAVTGEG